MSKWLVVSYFANVDGLAASHHIDDRLPWLRARGVEATLLSSTCGPPRTDVRHIRIASPAPSGLRYEARYFFRRRRQNFTTRLFRTLQNVVLLPFYLIEKLFVPLDSTWSWWFSGGVAAAGLALRRRPAVIYSTGGPISSHLAAIFAARLSGAPLIVELQDPLVYPGAGESAVEQRFAGWVEGLVFRRAAAVVFLTRAAADRAVARHGHGDKVFSIYPGANPRADGPIALARRAPDGRLRLLHVGSLSGSRDLATTLGALEIVARERPEIAAALTLRLLGYCDGRTRAQIDAFTAPVAIEAAGKVERHEARQAMNDADVLLLIQNTSDYATEQIPSKLYEYLHVGRPLLALIYRNPELAAMLESLGARVAQADDAAAVARCLVELWESWRAGCLTDALPSSPYTVEAAVRQLCELKTHPGTIEDNASATILMCEPFFWANEHLAVNAALIATVLAAYPACTIHFWGQSRQIELLREQLGPAELGRMQWRAVEFAPRDMRRVLPRMMRELPHWKQFLRSAGEKNAACAIACSCPPSGILALKWLLTGRRGERPVILIQHGGLNDLTWRRRNPFRRILPMRRILGWWQRPALRYVVMAERIVKELTAFVPSVVPYLGWMPLPYRFTAVAPHRLEAGRPLRFGFLGAASVAKGFDWFVRSAREIEESHPGAAEFHLIGKPPRRAEDEPAWPASLRLHSDGAMLEHAEFERLAASMDYIVLLQEPAAYRLVASGTVLDAFSYALPIVARRSPLTEEFFEQMGDIGYLVESPQELRDCVQGILARPPVQRYAAQSATIIQKRVLFEPPAVAWYLREIVEDARCALRDVR